MSSLAAVQADGYYNPPEWDPRKGSLKKFTGAKGHNQYLQSGACVSCVGPYVCLTVGSSHGSV